MNDASRHNYLVFHHDNLFRFRVVSRTRPEIEHVCDVSAWGGIGECSCEHFQFRLLPGIRARIATGQAARCSHLIAAREAFTDSMISRILNHEENNHDPED